MRRGAARLLTSLILAYFVGLIYAAANAGTYAGQELYGLLLLAVIVFAVLAIRDKPRLGTSFLLFYNASWIFFVCVGVALLLDFFKVLSLPIARYGGVPDTAIFSMSFGVFFVLNLFYVLRFKRARRFFLFPWAEATGGVAETERSAN